MRNQFFYLLALLCFFSCSENMEPESVFDIGRNDLSFTVDNVERNVVVYLPESYTETEIYPVVFMLHGSGGTGNKFYNISGWVGKAEQEGIIAVFPTAIEYGLIDGTSQTKWSSDGLDAVLPEGTKVKDDKVFIQYLVDELKSELSVDEDRFYICGFSNGSGFVKSEILPNMSHIFAAANVTGGVGIPVSEEIIGDRTMPVFNISGTLDAKIFEQIGDNTELPISGEELESHDFLWNKLTTMCDMMGLGYMYEETPNPPSWNQLTFTSKVNNTSAEEYRFMMVKEMTHVFPNGSNNPNGLNAVDHIWPWFMQWSL